MSLAVERAGGTVAERAAFVDLVKPYLAQDEAANNLILSLADQIANGGYAQARVEMLRAVDPAAASDAVNGTRAFVLQTEPNRLVICRDEPDEAHELLLGDLLGRGVELPGVVGEVSAARRTVAWWTEHSGAQVVPALRLGVYRLSRVIDKPRPVGRVVDATDAHRGIILNWFTGFNSETNDALGEPLYALERFKQHDFRRLCLWEVDDGVEPRFVSLAGVSGRTPNGRRIGPVYTPREERRRGYAEALVAEVCRQLLADGAKFCFLFTDLANPTSNHVYQDIGFEFLAEFAEFDFVSGS
ncbi:MAG: GNAT family N-acetyltransferase [Trueperaceae bacterium]|nr:GNAT family N-acetyltransferase [Trueperaceae bacterium]